MVEYDDLVSEILSESGACPDSVLERNLRNSAIDFFEHTDLWRTRITLDVEADTAVVSLPIEQGQSVSKITFCTFDGRELIQTVPHRVFAGGHLPTHYFHQTGGLNLQPVPKAEGQIHIEYVLKPNRKSTGLPEVFVNDWFEVLQHGALARTLSMAGMPWYDIRRADGYYQQYELGREKARRHGMHENHSRIRHTRFSW